MSKLFRMDSPLMRFLTKIADLMVLNILFCVTSIPLITIGASWTALYSVTLKMVRDEEGSVSRSTHVVADPQTQRLRTLTPIECERLNGFPDDWTAGMPERMRYFTMGNALVVPLVKAMGKRISALAEDEQRS